MLSLLTVLALLVAPVCAPLCAARGCASNAALGHCHEMTGMSANGAAQLTAPAKSCGPSNLLAILVKFDEQTSLSQMVRTSSLLLSLANSPAQRSFDFAAASRRADLPRPPESSPESRPLSIILRI